MVRKYMVSVVAMIAIIAMVISGCTTPTPEPPVEPPGPTLPDTGALIGEIIFTEEKSAVASIVKMAGDQVQLYAQPGISDVAAFDLVLEGGLPHAFSYGSYRDMRYNPVGPTFGTDDVLNPFSVPQIREAMMYLIDRDYVVGEILGGLGEPCYVLGARRFPESSIRYKDTVEAIEAKYAPKPPAQVRALIEPYMLDLGATWDNGWFYEGAPVEIKMLIRSDLPPFPATGDYFADQLEAIGFVTAREYKTGREASPIWLLGNPADGLWHVYTGGWGIPGIPRDQASTFAGMQTQSWYPVPLYAAYEEQLKEWDLGYYDNTLKLFTRDFATLAERASLFEEALEKMVEFSAANVICDMASVTAWTYDLRLIHNVSYGVGEGWTRALHYVDSAGDPVWRDSINVEMASMLVNPWNPVDGSNWTYDLTIKRDALAESGVLQNPTTGLYHALRVESVQLTVGNNLPVGFEGPQPDWLTLTIQPGPITVPDDAWAEWDAATGTFKTAAQRFPDPADRVAVRKSVATYPADIFDFPMHDGSTLSLADFLMAFILPLDIAQPASPIHEPANIASYNAFMSSFRGMRITSVNPLTIEYYSTSWYLDPDHWNVETLFPAWGQGGSNPWHMISIGWLASRDVALRFGTAKAQDDAVEWMDYTRGPSLSILANRLGNVRNTANADYRFMPYKSFMQSVYADPAFATVLGGADGLNAEIDERYANLSAWYTAKNHFWVDMGPFYLDKVFPIEKNVILKRFEDHPDPADKWHFLVTP